MSQIIDFDILNTNDVIDLDVLDNSEAIDLDVREGGGGGTTDYNMLSNKPQINGVTLTGNKTSADLGIQAIPTGGTEGQVLAKASDSDYDAEWVDAPGGDVTQEAFDALVEYVHDLSPVTTVSGAIAAVDDAAPLGAEGLVVNIDPVQDLHGYDSPWPAGGGKNLCDPDEREEITNNIHFFYDSGITLLANQAYTFSVSQTAAQLSIIEFNGSNLAVAYSKTFVTYTPTADTLVKLDVYYNSSYPAPSGDLSSVNCQLEKGGSATSYAPYSNFCPITGWTGANVWSTGVNVWDEKWEVGGLNTSTGADSDMTDRIRSKNYIPVKPSTTYYFYNGSINLVCLQYDINKTYLGIYTYQNPNQATLTMSASTYYIRFYMTGAYGTTYLNDISINYPSTDHDYHAYTGSTLSVSWQSEAGTVYGGTLDVTAGTLVVDRANIVSYAGETLPSTWISDRDVYSAGSIPTTGAQVVYVLATPVTYQLDPHEIALLRGSNNIWADTGNTSLTYRQDVGILLGKLTAQVAALNSAVANS